MIGYGRRRQGLPAPAHVVWDDLRAPRTDGTRAWLTLLEDEQVPVVLEAEECRRVLWSSLWTRRPTDRVLLTVEPDGDGSTLEFVWLGEGDKPSESTTGHIRKRLNRLLFGELRYSYGQ